VTTADTAAARPSAWQRFRTWRRARPFWGGFVAMLAGLEIYATSQQSIGDMEIKIGPGGMAAYVIPLMMVVGGLLAWFTPAQRHFYGIIIPAVAVYALLEINFGGWMIGTILGMVGGALIFAWTEDKTEAVAAEAEEPEPDGGEDAGDFEHSPRHAAIDELFDGPTEPVIPRQSAPDDDREGRPAREPGGGSGRLLAIAVPLLLVAAGLVAVKGAPAAYAAPCPATKTAVKPARTTPKATTPASPAPVGGVAVPSRAPSKVPTSPSPSPAQEPGLLGTIIGGIVDLLDPSESPSPSPPAESAPPSTSPSPRPAPASPAPAPSGKSAPRKPAPPCAAASPSASPAKRLAAAPGQVDVAAKPSRMTGSIVTMTNLVFQGIVDLPTADGPISVLKFTMNQAVTEDFSLLTYARGDHSEDVVFTTKTLTVKQNVVFYASRFQGKALGLIDVDYSPSNTTTPIPLSPIPIPLIFFTDPDIQLVWVNADVLTGTPSLTSTLV